MDSDYLDSPVQFVKGVGPRRAGLFSRIGIRTIRDLLFHLPCRYEDRSSIGPVARLRTGIRETVRGAVVVSDIVRMRGRKLSLFELVINDGSGMLKARWFNQSYLKKHFIVGQEVILHGIAKSDSFWRYGPVMDNPEYEIVSDAEDRHVHTNRVVPVYRVTEGITQRQFRMIMFDLIHISADRLSDYLPPQIAGELGLPGLAESMKQVHFPDSGYDHPGFEAGSSNYHQRLCFDELFLFEIGVAVLKKRTAREKGISFRCSGELRQALLQRLPFRLTNAQARVLQEVLTDMEQPVPMNRLIQGDVGCGKTVVVLLAMLHAVECGYQAALMAPTEILAEQHYAYIQNMTGGMDLSLALLTGSRRQRNLDLIASGKSHIVVGTHALIQEEVQFQKLGLAVIDEQHKFGVMQRAVLRKKGSSPDVLVMTATPIPRSLAMTLYGDLDCSVIDELPPKRQGIVTRHFRSTQKDRIYDILRKEISAGRQAYVVYPVIDESDKVSLKSAMQGRDAFEKVFPEFTVGILHGKMPMEERETVMSAFREKEIDILVCTTIIEVGVDVPNATLILIVHAERFGLSQLHQLRGRVGRGADASSCLLISYEPCGDDARRRLDIMVKSNDGFVIAEEDLSIRGPGDFLGTRQSGYPELKVASLIRDMKVLEKAKRAAFGLIDSSPDLHEFPSLKREVEVFWRGKADLYRTA